MAKKAEFNIETVKKYIFWVCIPIGLITTIIVTFLSVSSIGQQFQTRKNELNNQKKTVEDIRRNADHPNEQTIVEVNNCEKDLKVRVYSAWITLSKDQSERNQWPSILGQSFLNEISRLKFGDEITIDSREIYLNFVERYLPSLEEYVNRRRVQIKSPDGQWKEVDANSGESNYAILNVGMDESSSGNLPGEEDEMFRITGTVDWPNPETRAVKHLWGRLPKSNDVWFAQEELWVYHALLWVIKTSNSQATGTHNAIIKRIESLLIGQQAAGALSAQLGMSLGMGGGEENVDGGMYVEGGGMMVARTEEDVARMKKHHRYVDAENTPLPGEAEAPFAEFNRMPICLRLIVDQRHIPEILVNCANCAMPIEVLRVRINPGAARPFNISNYEAAAGDEGGGMEMDGGGGRGMGDVGYGSSPAPAPSASQEDIQLSVDGAGGIYGTNAVPIEIFGCINIFNPAVEYNTEVATGE